MHVETADGEPAAFRFPQEGNDPLGRNAELAAGRSVGRVALKVPLLAVARQLSRAHPQEDPPGRLRRVVVFAQSSQILGGVEDHGASVGQEPGGQAEVHGGRRIADRLRGDAGLEGGTDLGPRGAVGPAAEAGEGAQHHRRGIGLHRVTDAGGIAHHLRPVSEVALQGGAMVDVKGRAVAFHQAGEVQVAGPALHGARRGNGRG